MRFVDDSELSFCLTMSIGIDRDSLLAILGMVEVLPVPQTFDDFVWEAHQPGEKGLLNVFQCDEEDLIATLENNGHLGVLLRTAHLVSHLPGVFHYVAIYYSDVSKRCQYVEIQDGTVVANFDPTQDKAPEAVIDFFGPGSDHRSAMIKALEYRMEVEVKPEWLTDRTTTYLIDYNINNN